MNLLSVSEKITAFDHSKMVFHAEACLHSLDRTSNCQACYAICPLNAIQPGKPPELDVQKCQSCLACLPICPSGAFWADDALPNLLNCAARLETGTIELVCEYHPRPERGLKEAGAAIQIKGCLAGIGIGGYLALLALDLQKVFIRTDACDECALGSLKFHIEQRVAAVKKLLSAWKQENALCTREALAGQALAERACWQAGNPPLSRRELFGMASRMGQVAASRLLSADHATGKHPPRQRQRMIAAMAHLPELPVGTAGLSLQGLGFAMLEVSDQCTACGVCARVCPSGALEFENDADQHFRLTFNPGFCIACGICTQVCEPGAIDLQNSPSLQQVFGDAGPIPLIEGELARCKHCQALYAARPGSSLCALCAFRLTNPFGSRLPPGSTAGSRSR